MNMSNFRKYMLCRAKRSVMQRTASLAQEVLFTNVDLQLNDIYSPCAKINGVVVDNLSARVSKKYS